MYLFEVPKRPDKHLPRWRGAILREERQISVLRGKRRKIVPIADVGKTGAYIKVETIVVEFYVTKNEIWIF